MATKLSENMSKLIHRMGREREDRLIGGEMKLTGKCSLPGYSRRRGWSMEGE
jgi:hypothetical protein